MAKEWKILDSGEVLFKGTLYPGPNVLHKKVTFNPKKWFAHWKENIEEIKKSKFDISEIQHLHENFVRDVLLYGYLKQMIKKHQQINELANKLNIAFYQSYSNYRESRKGIFGFFAGLFANKIMDMKFPKLPIKE